MTSLISLLVVVTVSLIATRIATIALTLTGLSYDAAYFQALSAFSGVGYTTGESEDIVKHPVRRRIIAVVILIGNIGLVTAVASLLLTFVDAGDLRDELLRAGLILAGLAVIWYLFTNRLIDDISSRLIRRLLQHYTDIEVRDYADLLSLTEGYGVSQILVDDANDWLADRTLAELRLADEGLTVLGIRRADGNYLGVPQSETRIRAGDRLVMYGDTQALEELDEREKGPSGAMRRQQGEAKQRERLRQQERHDAAYDDAR